MNRQEWESEKRRMAEKKAKKTEKAKRDLRAFEKANGGKTELERLRKIVSQYCKLRGAANLNRRGRESKSDLPELHVRCAHYEDIRRYDETTHCDEIVYLDDVEKNSWAKVKYTCGHLSGSIHDTYFCPKHAEDATKVMVFECFFCEGK